ncbi:MAG: PucR family transcriptional regulator [Terracoccus sp.]
MPVSLRYLLGRADLDLRLVAGSAAGVEVGWAHAIELQDPRPWLTGGELVLTTGLRLPGPARDRGAYVDGLAAVGVAALAFGIGVRFDAIPVALVSRCREVGLPLVEVPLPTPFIAVSQAVAQALAREQRQEVEQVVESQRSLARATVRGGVSGLTRALARLLGARVVLLDEYATPRARSGGTEPLERLTRSVFEEGGARRRAGITILDDGRVELHPLSGSVTHRGWLAWERATPLSAVERMVLHHAVSLASLHLDRPLELERTRGGLGALLLRMLLSRDSDRHEAADHLSQFGFEADDRLRLLFAQVGASAAFAEAVQTRFVDRGYPHLQTDYAAGHVILVRGSDAPEAAEVVLETLTTTGHPAAAIGVSRDGTSLDVAAALVPAQRAARAAERAGTRIGWSDRLTLAAVLDDDQVRRRVREHTDATITPLSGSPALDALDLPRSLEVFLQHNGAWEPAARELGVHRHTLRARMERVEQLTGLGLDVADNRTVLALALATRDTLD